MSSTVRAIQSIQAGRGASAAASPALSGAIASYPKLGELIAKPQTFAAGGRTTTIDYKPAVAALQPYVASGQIPAGSIATNATWEIWGHSVIPAHERDSVMFVITAEGSAYKGTTKLAYADGTQVEFTGRIVGIGIARDHARKDGGAKGDECRAPLTVVGKPGEIVKVRYCRLSVGAKGEFLGGGTPDDSLRGGSGAYMGRQAVVEIGKARHIISPEDHDREYGDMVRYYFDGITSGKKPDLDRLQIESDKRAGK